VSASLAFRTDLALRSAEGAEVRDDHGTTVVRMPDNPAFRWGNFLLVPEAGDPAARIREHAAAFPGAGFTTVGVDDPRPELDEDEWAAAGFTVEALAVLTASAAPDVPAAGVRRLASDADWAAETAIALALEADPDDSHREYARRRTVQRRRAAAAGRLIWLGVEQDGEVVATAGIGDVGGGVARFQDVQTLAAFRRRGHASALIAAGARVAAEAFGSSRLVLVAERDGPAIGLYRRLGFQETETQLQLSRVGDPVGPDA
jgi:ribosomal protein S18 acetylase RimI-like enzyme